MPYTPGHAQHLGDRQQQQDSFGFSDPADARFLAHGGFLGIVADGMGGMAHGAEASQSAVRSFLAVYQGKPESEPIPSALDRALRQANAAVHSIGDDVGTTLVAAVTRGRELHWISAGDSHIYLLRNGRLVRLNAEHNYSAVLYRQVAAGNLARPDAESHPEREHLTSYLGGSEVAMIDATVKPFPLQPGDRVILCSDGAYRTLPAGEIVECLSSGGGSQAACEAIVERTIARHRPHQDNVTVMAWECLETSPAQPVAPQHSIGWKWLWVAVLLLIASLGAAAWFGWHFARHLRGVH